MNWKLLYAIAIAIAIATISVQSWHLPSVHPLLKISDKDLIKKALASVVAISLCSVCSIQPVYSDSRLNAPTAAGTRVNSDPESLLRYGLPINSKELRDIQESIESAKINLKTRRILYAKGDISNAKALLNKYADKIIATAPKNHINQVKESMSKMNSYFPAFETSIAIESDASAGSLQERKGLDDTFLAQDNLAKELSNLEELMVPDDFRRNIPEEYANLPQLQGRAEVEVVFKKTDGSQFDVDGVLYDDIDMTLILDGYNAPITAGNFIDLVNNKFYDKKLVTRSDGFVVQLGDADPSGEVHGYVPPGSKEERKIPLELSFKGDPELLYGLTSEDDGRGYAAATLPFQSYGALGMARSEFEPNSASSQFFMLLFESDLTPAGKNMLDGRYTCFGYTVKGADLLKGVKEGDIVSSMKVIKGMDKFIPAK